MTTTTAATNTIDWSQVVVNLAVLSEASGYSFGLAHDLTLAQIELAKREHQTTRED